MFRTVLEIYDPERDTWSRIEHGNWKSERKLDKHIEDLKKQNPREQFFKCRKGQTNIPEQYKYMFDFYERYPSAEARNNEVKKFYEFHGYPELGCPIII